MEVTFFQLSLPPIALMCLLMMSSADWAKLTDSVKHAARNKEIDFIVCVLIR
jgi:hypothetical protein